MKDKFIIDRQFGIALWVDVVDGIVQFCYNEEPKFIEKMNERYVGKSITFLNEDFIGRAMKGTYHHLRPECLYVLRNNIASFEMRIKHLYHESSHTECSKERRAEIKGQIKELEPQQYKLERELLAEKLRMFNDHKFIVK